MADRVCTRFKDTDGLDLGCHLVTKEYVLEAYPSLVPWMKAPALWLWGCGASGVLGNNSIASQSSPVQTISGGTAWRSVDANGNSVAAIKTDGTLWMWGDAAGGALGNNSTTDQSSPVQTVSSVNVWKSVSVFSSGGAAAIKTDGTLWLWGSTSQGRLGDNTQINRSSPVQTISGGTNWKSVSTGSDHTAAIKTDGTLWLWGCSLLGLLGNNLTAPAARSSPVQTISGGTNWKSVSAASVHTAAIKTDGTLWIWGSGASGVLGNNSIASQSSPVQTVSGGTNWKSACNSGSNSVAIKTDGTLWTWGFGGDGQLGNNSTISQSSPVQIISGGTNWSRLGRRGAIKTDGTLWLWGCQTASNTRLGNLSTVSRSSPVQTISGGTGWRSVSTSSVLTAAIRDEGEY